MDKSQEMEVRKNLRIPDTLAKQAEYWAEKKGVTFNAYVQDALISRIRMEHQDYEASDLLCARMNQMCEMMQIMMTRLKSVEVVMLSMQDSFISLAGADADDYL